jgi:hypothetical protein
MPAMAMGDAGFLPSIRRATLREACGVRARRRDGARTDKEHALSFWLTFMTTPPLLNFHRGVLFVLELPPGAKRAKTGGEERQNIKAA